MNAKIRRISLICVAAILYSTLLTSYYHHHDYSYRSGCGLCKIVAEPCALDDAAPFRSMRPYFIPLYSCADSSAHIVVSPHNWLIARAPPS